MIYDTYLEHKCLVRFCSHWDQAVQDILAHLVDKVLDNVVDKPHHCFQIQEQGSMDQVDIDWWGLCHLDSLLKEEDKMEMDIEFHTPGQLKKIEGYIDRLLDNHCPRILQGIIFRHQCI